MKIELTNIELKNIIYILEKERKSLVLLVEESHKFIEIRNTIQNYDYVCSLLNLLKGEITENE